MKIRILGSASRDLLAGYRFYEQQAPGLGDYFLNTLYSDIDSLRVTAGIHPQYFTRYYRLLSKRFPFAVYYRLEDETILVHAILDCRRNPGTTRERFE